MYGKSLFPLSPKLFPMLLNNIRNPVDHAKINNSCRYTYFEMLLSDQYNQYLKILFFIQTLTAWVMYDLFSIPIQPKATSLFKLIPGVNSVSCLAVKNIMGSRVSTTQNLKQRS